MQRIVIFFFFLCIFISAQSREWYCFQHGKASDDHFFTKFWDPMNGTQFVIGHTDIEETFLMGHLRNGVYTYTTLYLYLDRIWYAALHSFKGTFPPQGDDYGIGIYTTVFPDKVSWLQKPRVEPFRRCEVDNRMKRRSFEPVDLNTRIVHSTPKSECFTYAGSQFYFVYTLVSKDEAGNLHFAGNGTNKITGEKCVLYGHYQPRDGLFTFHVFHAEINQQRGKVEVMQWYNGFKDGMLYELAYPYFHLSYPQFRHCQ